MTHLPFEFIDRRNPPQSIDSTSPLLPTDSEFPPRPNPFGSLPTVQELRARLRGDAPAEPAQPKTRHRRTDEVAVGVDVARFGADATAICVRDGQKVIHLASYRKEDTMRIAGRVAAVIRRFNPHQVFVDEIGIGAGVVDRLRELKFRNIRGVNASARARDPRKYANLRAEMFARLRQRFEEGMIQIPRDQELVEQLTSLKYSYTSSGQLQLESKESMSRRRLRSPDKADALALAFCFHRSALRARL